MTDAEELYRLEPARGDLDSPLLLHALHGFVDAGGVVQQTVDHLLAELPHEVVATFDVDQLHDYRARRPPMVFVEDHWESVDAPELVVYRMVDRVGTPFLLMTGPEPDTQWERFITAVASLVARLGVRLTLGLTAIPMGVPHTRPVRLTAHATDPTLVAGYTPWVGTVVVPGAVGNLLEYRFGKRGLSAMGLVATVPHYLAQVPYPAAVMALLDGVSRAGGLVLPHGELAASAADTARAIQDQIEESAEGLALVHTLEEQYDQSVAAQQLPTADELGAELERFLASQPRPDDPSA